VNQEREHGYAGYRGMITLAQELARTLESPIWEAVRRPAPWHELPSLSGKGVGGEGVDLPSPSRRGVGGEGVQRLEAAHG